MLRFFLLLLSILSSTLLADTQLENTTCKACHPAIYAEYQHSMHAHASIFNDPIHKAIWDKHPNKKQGNYTCAQCHTPSDHSLKNGKGFPEETRAQKEEPISCQGCHRIESITKHAKSNTNVIHSKPKYFYSADSERKGQKVLFKKTSRFFGLIKSTTGSPYHDIDYSNEGYYTGAMCLGCHDHKQNAKGFAICDFGYKQGKSKATCIGCHMPRKPGSFVSLKHTATHASHTMSIHDLSSEDLGQYLKLSFAPKENGFVITLHNEATHTLFAQPLRLAMLNITIHRGDEVIALPPRNYVRIIGTQGKPSMPWLADTVIRDTSIKALETRVETFAARLHTGDRVEAELGYYLVNPKAAGKLGISDPSATAYRVLSRREFVVR